MLKRVKIDRESLVHTAKSQPGSNKNQKADISTFSISSDPNSLSSLPAVGVGGGGWEVVFPHENAGCSSSLVSL